MTVQDTDQTRFSQDWEHWRQRHEAALADEHGFLAITHVHWLSAEEQRFDDAPGTWRTDSDGITVTLGPDEELVISGQPVRERYSFGVIPERGGINAVWGDAVIEVARRGGYDIIRPRHPEHPLRTSFAGVPVYEPSRRWVVPGRYIPFVEPRPTTVGSVVEGLQHVYAAPGYVQFEIGGQPLRLTAFSGHAPGGLTLLFTDATSGVTTYPANRSLQVDAPEEGGGVLLDFNRAVNLPCAFTDFATCPLPPAENRLPVAVEAGEKMPYERA
jgi:uncharacterized protein (DUF1684 family)